MRPDTLFHTTGLHTALDILTAGEVLANPFVSFSAGSPVYSDISASAPFVAIAFRYMPVALQLAEVAYTDEWYTAHREQAAYIAGEGWDQQYTEPDEAYDEDGWSDDEMLAEYYSVAECSAFTCKSDEREWVSEQEGYPVTFDIGADIEYLIVDDEPSRESLAAQLAIENIRIDIRINGATIK